MAPRKQPKQHKKGAKENLRKYFDELGDEDTVTFVFRTKQSLFRNYRKTIKRFRFLATRGGEHHWGKRRCYDNKKKPIIRLNMVVHPGENEFEGSYRCSLIFLKKNMYLCAYGRGDGEGQNLAFYEFEDATVTFGFKATPGISIGYPATRSNFNVNGNTLYKAVMGVSSFVFAAGSDTGFLAMWLEFFMWCFSEATRFDFIFNNISHVFMKNSRTADWWNCVNPRSDYDWNTILLG